MLVLINQLHDTNNPQIVITNQRIAQLIVIPYISIEFIKTDELTEAEKGESGFGSTEQ